MKKMWLLVLAIGSWCLCGAGYPSPHERDFIVNNYRFADGETMRNLRIHYTTL